MKERPILFQGSMVRALLAGTKTQTRRVAKCALLDDGTDYRDEDGWPLTYDEGTDSDMRAGCPYGQPGDRLWVRETARCIGQSTDFTDRKVRFDVDYKAKGGASFRFDLDAEPRWFPRVTRNTDGSPRWQPGIHMPRWASRILLEITEVRVQRLQEISEEDAEAEGVHEWASGACAAGNPHGYTAVGYYSRLWDQINGAGSWDANPWCWAVSFRRVQP